MDSHLHTGSLASDLAASFASHLAKFASFPGLRASGGVTWRRLFRQLHGRPDCTPRCARLISCLVSASCRKEQICAHVIRTTVVLCLCFSSTPKDSIPTKTIHQPAPPRPITPTSGLLPQILRLLLPHTWQFLPPFPD